MAVRFLSLAIAILLLCIQADQAGADTAAGLAAYEAGDFATARRLLKAEAEKGDAAAQAKYGQLLARGFGGPKDPGEAFKWFQEAADQGDFGAVFYLGVSYYRGEGVRQDYKRAAELFRKAAEEQIVNAEFALAIAYLKGQGVGVEPLAARFWMRRAAEHGDESAAQALPQIEKNFADLFAQGPGAVEGGDGSSQERALLLPDAKSEKQGIETEHAVVKFFFPGWTWGSQAVMQGKDGRTYDQITLVNDSGSKREIYFDISNWYGKWK